MGRFEINSRKPSPFEVAINRVVSQTLSVAFKVKLWLTVAPGTVKFAIAANPTFSILYDITAVRL